MAKAKIQLARDPKTRQVILLMAVRAPKRFSRCKVADLVAKLIGAGQSDAEASLDLDEPADDTEEALELEIGRVHVMENLCE